MEPHESPQEAALPRHAVFTFNEEDRHADLHIWLYPDTSGARFGFAIFLREGPLHS